MGTRWEYATVSRSVGSASDGSSVDTAVTSTPGDASRATGDFLAQLNALGEEEWEVVESSVSRWGTSQGDVVTVYLLKRPSRRAVRAH